MTIWQGIAVMVPTAATGAFLAYASNTLAAGLVTGLVTLVLLPVVLHRAWRLTFPRYREWSDRSSQIRDEIRILGARIAAIFDKYRNREKHQRFKQAYDLAGRQLRDLEEVLSVGMYRERSEVFVTAFMRGGVAVRVTASIGSPFRCSASDNPGRWRDHIKRLGCDEIRQYHNHPVHNGSTCPSAADVRATQSVKTILGPDRGKLRSLIICWNGIREWKVFEHDETGRHWLHFEFDAGVWPVGAASAQAGGSV